MQEWIYVVTVQSKDRPTCYAVPVVATSAQEAHDAAGQKFQEAAEQLHAGQAVIVEVERLMPWQTHEIDE